MKIKFIKQYVFNSYRQALFKNFKMNFKKKESKYSSQLLAFHAAELDFQHNMVPKALPGVIP